MANKFLLLGVLQLAGWCRLVLTTQRKGWHSEYLIPQEENESCPNGTVISCGNVINVNGTVLRYERDNMTFTGSTVPTKNCRWTIRGPPGTSIFMKTTCYHHVHAGNDTEYEVCWSYSNSNPKGGIASSKSCGQGYEVTHFAPLNEEDFTVYYKNGETYAMGFTTEITFLGEPTPTTTPRPESATSLTRDTTSHAIAAKLDRAIFYAISSVLLTTQARF